MGEKTYYSQDGEPRTIHQMVRAEPEWAASRIQAGESALTRAAELEFERDQYREWWANLSAAMREQEARISTLTAEISERCAAARERNRELAVAEARVAELNGISMSLAADVLRELVLDESRQADRIRERVTQWRRQWDEISARAALAGKQPQEGE